MLLNSNTFCLPPALPYATYALMMVQMLTSPALTEQTQSRLRIRLRFSDAPELAVLPWEYLYAPQLQRFVALSNRTLLNRYLLVGNAPQPQPIQSRLTLLVVISSPRDVEPLDVDDEWHRLQQRLRKGDVHLLHFIGHGCDDFGNCRVWSAAWSPSGGEIVTASSDGTAKVWPSIDGLVQLLTERIQRPGARLTPAEQVRFGVE